jgi:hypothetical protein
VKFLGSLRRLEVKAMRKDYSETGRKNGTEATDVLIWDG